MTLFRYIPMNRFFEMVTKQEIVFVSPLLWKDNYEGLLYQAVKSKNGREEICKLLKKLNKSDFIIDLLINEFAVSLLKCSCWCKEKDSVAMWEAYSDNNQSVMVQTTKSKIESLKNNMNQHVKVRSVDYCDSISLEDEIKRAFISENEASMVQVFSTKRSHFSFEKEIRAFIGGAIDNSNTSTYIKPLPLKIHIPINDFIEDVIINPNADSKTVFDIQSLCNSFNIKCTGKSNVYDFSINSIILP